jgi:competence protein ComEC
MAATSETAIVSARLAKAGGFAVKLVPLWRVLGRAFETEVALRRPFLWLPVAAGTGVVLYLYADREPSLWLIAPAAVPITHARGPAG